MEDDITRRRFAKVDSQIAAVADSLVSTYDGLPAIPAEFSPDAYAIEHGLPQDENAWLMVLGVAVGRMIRLGLDPEAVPEVTRRMAALVMRSGQIQPPPTAG